MLAEGGRRGMDAEDILNQMIRGTLGGRRKRHRGTLGALVGGRLLNAQTLLAAAGVAWGVYEASRSPGTGGPAPTPSPAPAGGAPPPLPRVTPVPPAAAPAEVGLIRLVRLAVSAARADGNLSLEERGRILDHARAAGLESEVAAELQQPRPLAEIVAGVQDQALKNDLYTLAFSIVRADEAVSGAERVFLAQLAARLGLDAAATQRLEAAAVAEIDGGGERKG
jgi:uncharacterized membrane protein YebE (DUF533 family)